MTKMKEIIQNILSPDGPVGLTTLLKLADEVGYKIDICELESRTLYIMSNGRGTILFGNEDFATVYSCLKFKAFERDIENQSEESKDESALSANLDTQSVCTNTPSTTRDAQLARMEERIARLERRIGAEMSEAEIMDEYWHYLGKVEAMVPEFKKHNAILSIDRVGGKAYYARVDKPTEYSIDRHDLKKLQSLLWALRKRSQEKANSDTSEKES